jgi:cytochrome c
MRARPTLIIVLAATALLGACGKHAATPADQAPATDDTAAAPAPAQPTPAQVQTLLASLPAPFNTADPAHGEHIFVQCEACHTNTKGGPNMTGPNLYGLFGRKAGSVADYSYSDAVKGAGFTWDAAHLDTWLTDPRAMLPGTKMGFMGLKDAKDRADVIAYLKVSTTPAP